MGHQFNFCNTCGVEGEVVDVFLQAQHDGKALKRLIKRLLQSHGSEPRKSVTDNLQSNGVAHRELIPEAIHSTKQYESNRAAQSHEKLTCQNPFRLRKLASKSKEFDEL